MPPSAADNSTTVCKVSILSTERLANKLAPEPVALATVKLIYEYPLRVPIKKFEKVAVVKIYNNKDLIDTQDLFAQKDIANKNIFFKGIQNIAHYIFQ